MFRKFVNRKFELDFLSERWRSNRFEFIVIYGRRRIGKTEIIKQFIRDKPRIYFLCDKKGTEENIKRFKKTAALYLNEPEIVSNDLEEIFKWLIKRVKKRFVVVFDEFSYLVEKDSAVPSVFQRVIDEVLRHTKIFLILCGSSLSMMERGVLSYKSPLYGRKTGHLKIERLPFSSYFEFYPKNDFEKNVEFYSISGGIPFYMEKFSDGKSTLENVRTEIVSRTGRLYEEVDFLLKEELREPDTYKKIIEAISLGNTKLVEIANHSNIPANQLTKYLGVLINLGLIKKETRVTEKNPKSKRVIYSIQDNFFDFYFTFVEPFESDLVIDEFEGFESNFLKNFNCFVGKKFENLVREEIIKKHFGKRFNRIGKWWGWKRKEERRETLEIDVVALNEKTREILFAECKWRSRVNAEKVCKELAGKTEYVQWHNEKRKEYLAVFAKSFSKRISEFEGRPVFCFDLKDLESFLRKPRRSERVGNRTR